MFKLKDGELGCPDAVKVGRKSWGDEEPYKKGWVDQACFGDIDWQAMENEHDIEEIEKEWDDMIVGKSQWMNPEYYLERYGTKEKYVHSQISFHTYAVVTEDGEWHEAGRMGFWAISAASPAEQGAWSNSFWDTFMKDMKPDTLLTIVDCHI